MPIPNLLLVLSHRKLEVCKTLDVPFPINSCPDAKVPTPVPPLSTVKMDVSRFAEVELVVVIA